MRRLVLRAFAALARSREANLADVDAAPPPSRTYDFREGPVSLKHRLDTHLTEAKVSWLLASVDLWNLGGPRATGDVARLSNAFREDVRG